MLVCPLQFHQEAGLWGFCTCMPPQSRFSYASKLSNLFESWLLAHHLELLHILITQKNKKENREILHSGLIFCRACCVPTHPRHPFHLEAPCQQQLTWHGLWPQNYSLEIYKFGIPCQYSRFPREKQSFFFYHFSFHFLQVLTIFLNLLWSLWRYVWFMRKINQGNTLPWIGDGSWGWDGERGQLVSGRLSSIIFRTPLSAKCPSYPFFRTKQNKETDTKSCKVKASSV